MPPDDVDFFAHSGANDVAIESELSQHNTMLGGIARIGRVVAKIEGDAEEPGDIPRVLVQVGSRSQNSYIRNWMPWVTTRAGYDAEWWQPQMDEQVLVLAPSGNLEQGVIVGSLYRGSLTFDPASDGITERDPIPKNDKDKQIHQRIYQDGTCISYDKNNHRLNLALKQEATGDVLLNLSTEIQGDKGKASLRIGEQNAIMITADAKSDNEKITLTAGATEITINKDGVVNINAGSNDITITGNVKVTGTLDVS